MIRFLNALICRMTSFVQPKREKNFSSGKTTCDPCISVINKIFLNNYGFEISRQSSCPVAADGSPLPWYTYPAIEYFNQWDVRGLNIFEYSSGYSSFYWSRRGANVYSVEHNSEWFEQVSLQSSALKALTLASDRDVYSKTIHQYDVQFDLIVIDGVWRNDCAREALTHCGKDTLIILDNSDWYTDVATFLRQNGYFQIDWNGFGPINQYTWTTSLFLPLASPCSNRIGMPTPIGGIQVRRDEEFW